MPLAPTTRPSFETATLRIATRSSALAVLQAKLVASAFAACGAASELTTFTTVGDRILDRPLARVGSKGLFTQEPETALRDGSVDCCVHSLKDLPTDSPPDLVIAGVLRREDSRDALIVRRELGVSRLEELPAGIRVGTSSPRRRAQLNALRPDLDVVDLRGNVATRLKKVKGGIVDAAILARAGLVRLGLGNEISSILDAPDWLPAPGQGAIAIQARASDADFCQLARSVSHIPTLVAVTAERAFLAEFDGGCQLPLGALAIPTGDPGHFVLHGLIEDANSGRIVRRRLSFLSSDAVSAGCWLAEVIMSECSSLSHRAATAGYRQGEVG